MKRYLEISAPEKHEEAKRILAENGISFEEIETNDYSIDSDCLYEEAKRLAIESGKISPAFFQRRLKVGYSRAARLVDMLEDQGVVGPADGAKPRKVLIEK